MFLPEIFEYKLGEEHKFLTVCVWSRGVGGVAGEEEEVRKKQPESRRARYTNGAARR